MSVAAYSDIVQGPLASFLKHSQAIGGEVAEQAQHVEKLFQAQLQFLTHAACSQSPSQSDLDFLLKPTSQQIIAIQEMREDGRRSELFDHLSAISESITALGWVTFSFPAGPYITEMIDASQYFTNRVLRQFKEKNQVHVEWVKAWIKTLTDLQKFVKQHHTTGLVWGLKTGHGAPPPSHGDMPRTPPIGDLALYVDPSQDRSAIVGEISKGESVTSVLKRVTPDMQTHKSSGLQAGSTPVKEAPSQSSLSENSADKLEANNCPGISKKGKKWMVENQNGKHDLVIDGVQMNNVVYIFKCENSTLTVKGKLSSVILDSCRKTSVVVDTVVTSIEFIDCQSVQMQVLGKVPTITIDKTDGCQMYLSEQSMDVEIYSCKSSGMNVMVPKGDGDYKEQPIPEQCRTTVSFVRLTTVAVQYKR